MSDAARHIRLRDIHLRYGTTPILDGVSLDIASGEFIVVVGASGSGKTSLLRLAAGFLKADRGTVAIDDAPITAPGAERAVVFQDDALFPWLTVRDNVAFPLKLRGDRARKAKADAQLQAVGLEGFGDRRLWELSGGQRQRVGLARALITQPAFLLMDEPFAALDALTRAQMQVALLEVWSRHRQGVLFITHDIDEALLLATRVVVLAGRPAKVAQTIDTGFARRVLEGEKVRTVRHDPAFQSLREQILDSLFEPAANTP